MKLAVQLETVSQYAKRHKISRQATLKRIKKGKIKAFKVGSIWLIIKKTKRSAK